MTLKGPEIRRPSTCTGYEVADDGGGSLTDVIIRVNVFAVGRQVYPLGVIVQGRNRGS